MKHQKVVALIILLLSAAFAFTSCNNDGYSLDKFWLEVGTIEKQVIKITKSYWIKVLYCIHPFQMYRHVT